jgi:Mn2+/Fe2+ NRAMP family transporter
MAAWTFPLMAMIQEMCARIALVTGQGLAANIRATYSKKILYICTFLLFIANTLNIGADLGAMAKAVQLLAPNASFVFLVIFIGLFGLIMEIIIPYREYAKYLKWLVISLLSYIATGFMINMDWSSLFINGLIPQIEFTKTQLLLITGILGTTISPYLFFWQTSQEVEAQIDQGKVTLESRQGTNKEEIKEMRQDVWTGMFLSNVVMFFIIAVCANTLFVHGITDIQSASDAAKALEPFAGRFATLLFAIGIIGTGLLAVPVLAGSTAYAFSESMGWKEGLYWKLKEARAFYGVIAISVAVGILINFIGIDPIKALIYSAIANGIIAPIIIICIVHISSSAEVMGEFKNKRLTKIVGWVVAGLMGITATATIVAMFV